MDVKAYMEKGFSLGAILDEVRKEYAEEQKKEELRKKNEEDKKRAAEAEKLKRKTARAALMKAWKDYAIVISEAMPADSFTDTDIDKTLGEVEEALRALETTIDLLEAAESASKPKEQKDIKKPKAMSDEEILIDFLRKINF